jgi:hypothetical protein
MTEIAKILASLAAILALAWLCRRRGRGGDVRIRDADHARALANEALFGFEPVEIAVDRAGIGALLRDAGGRQMIVRRHGARFVGRLLDPAIEARLDRGFLTVATGEPGAAPVTLDLGERAQFWAAGFRHLAA